jgi:hypothetical protein
MEELTQNPEKLISDVMALTKLNKVSNNIDLDFVLPFSSRWETYASDQWFEKIEAECEGIMNDFFWLNN